MDILVSCMQSFRTGQLDPTMRIYHKSLTETKGDFYSSRTRMAVTKYPYSAINIQHVNINKISYLN